ENVLVLVDQHGLGGGRSSVEPDYRAHDLPRLELRLLELRNLVELAEVVGFGAGPDERRTCRVAEALFASVGDVTVETLDAGERAGLLALGEPVNRRAQRGVILSALGDVDELLDRNVLGVFVAALVPRLRNAQPPALLEKREVGVGTAEQKDVR